MDARNTLSKWMRLHAVTDRRPSRNLTAEDLGLELFCGAEPRRAGTPSVSEEARKPVLGDSSPLTLSAEMPTAPTHFEFNEEQSDEGPDPHDAEVEIEMELEARNHGEEKCS